MSSGHTTDTGPHAHVSPATPLGRKLVRYIVGFGVGVGVGLAPYLGMIDVPGFRSLRTLLPTTMEDTAIPLAAALMGTLAAAVQWYAGERVTRKRLRRLFAVTLVTALAAFIILTVVRDMVVRDLSLANGRKVSRVVGFVRPHRPPCTEEVSDRDCLMLVTLDPAKIDAFWGEGQVRLARLSLLFSYLLFTSSFGTLVGLIILREGMGKKK